MIFLIIWPYIVLSAIVLGLKWKRERLTEAQKNLFLVHILGVITFTISWMPFVLVHFLSFAVPSISGFTANTAAVIFKFFALGMFCLSGMIFSVLRLMFCYSLRSIIKSIKDKRMKADERFDYFLNESEDGDERRMSTFVTGADKSAITDSKESCNKNMDQFGNSFINLTNRETFNNLIGTYSAITLILKNIYHKYYTDKNFAEMVDNLSSQSYSYPSSAIDKVRQFFKLSDLPESIKGDFCAFTDTNNELINIE